MQLDKKNSSIIFLSALLVALFYWAVIAKTQSSAAAVLGHQGQAMHAAEVIHWKMVTSWPKGFPGLGTEPEKFAQTVNTMSAGRLQIKVYGAKEIVPALAVFDAVSQGNIEMGHSAAYYWKGKIPASVFFTTVPFGMTAQEMNAWLYDGGGMQLWRELYAPFNIIPLAGGNSGVQMAGWFNKEINSLADMQGLIMRIPGVAGEVLNRVGGQSVNIPGGDIYTSLKTGVIDATEWVGPYNDLAMGFHEVAKYYYYPGWHEPGSVMELSVNKQAFEALPTDLQAIVVSAARELNQAMLDQYTAKNNAALKELVERHGVQLRKLPDDVLLALKQASESVLEELAAEDPQTRKVYDAYKIFAENVSHYHQVSEKAYLQARDL
jgi:TRAP-type mannitol/chloroaromatic compound transport system substrate-binding protein